jgi:hypothetical protein
MVESQRAASTGLACNGQQLGWSRTTTPGCGTRQPPAARRPAQQRSKPLRLWRRRPRRSQRRRRSAWRRRSGAEVSICGDVRGPAVCAGAAGTRGQACCALVALYTWAAGWDCCGSHQGQRALEHRPASTGHCAATKGCMHPCAPASSPAPAPLPACCCCCYYCCWLPKSTPPQPTSPMLQASPPSGRPPPTTTPPVATPLTRP